MSIKFAYKGDVSSARMLRREARKQLDILREHMAFRKLYQGIRHVRNASGVEMSVQAFGSIATANIYVPVTTHKEDITKGEFEHFCWCTCCFTIGEIVECIGEDVEHLIPNSSGWYTYPEDNMGTYEEPYPDVLLENDLSIDKFNGYRYRVALCQKKYKVEFVCIATDWATYKIDDEVILTHLGTWEKTESDEYRLTPTACRTCAKKCDKPDDVTACGSNPRSGAVVKTYADIAAAKVDGAYIITGIVKT